MGLTLLTDDKGIKVFRKDKTSSAGNPYTTYCLKVSSKDKDDNWQSAFVDVFFKKGVSVNNKAVIKIKNAFPTINTYNGKSSIRWMITDFNVVEQGEAPTQQTSCNDEFMNIPDGIDEVLPFN